MTNGPYHTIISDLSRKIVVSLLGRVRYVCFRVLSFTMISSRGPTRAL